MITRIACGQFAAAPGDVAGNVTLMTGMIGEAAAHGAALIVFPEMSLSGYLPPGEAKEAAVSPEGTEVAGMLAAARAAGMWVLFGLAEARGEGRISNSMVMADPAGRIAGLYRKVHLFQGEEGWAEPGEEFVVIDAGFTRVGAWICYDGRFPEAARTLAASGAELALAGAAWLGPAEEWELVMRARALDNGIFTAGAALQGSHAGMSFHGESLISDPHGRVISRAREGRDMVIFGDFDHDAVASFRSRLPLLRDLRPAAYRAVPPGGAGRDVPRGPGEGAP